MEAVVVHETLRAFRRAKMHAPPILEVDRRLMPSTLSHIILQSRALALPALATLLQAVAGHIQAGGQPGRLVHQRRALREGRELDSVAQPPGFCLVTSRAGILLARRETRLLPGSDQLTGAPQSLSCPPGTVVRVDTVEVSTEAFDAPS